MKRSALVLLATCACGVCAMSACGGDDAVPPKDGGAIESGTDASVADAATGDGGGTKDAATEASSEGGADAAAGARWVTGYFAGYEKALYPIDQIEWSGLTHLAVAFVLPRSDGTLDETLFIDATNGPALARALVAAAHANGKKVIASIGGAGSHAQWVGASSNATRATFVANLKKLVSDYAYDGLDLDWEPVAAADAAAVEALVKDLRAALPNATLTMPTGYINVNAPDDLSLYPKLAPYLDQINLMTYGMAGAYQGWKSWHSSALHQTDGATPTSVESSINAYLTAGVPPKKLGVGAGFYGLCYTPPVNAPAQALGGATIVADDGTMSFAHIMTTYVTAQSKKYDGAAKVPYLTFAAATGPQGCGFISYEDEQSIADKGAFVKSKGLGGAIVWTINQGYLASAAPGARNPLLVALRTSVLQ